MPYVEDRLVHDADSHLMEMSDCLNPYFEKTCCGAFLPTQIWACVLAIGWQ